MSPKLCALNGDMSTTEFKIVDRIFTRSDEETALANAVQALPISNTLYILHRFNGRTWVKTGETLNFKISIWSMKQQQEHYIIRWTTDWTLPGVPELLERRINVKDQGPPELHPNKYKLDEYM